MLSGLYDLHYSGYMQVTAAAWHLTSIVTTLYTTKINIAYNSSIMLYIIAILIL